MLKGFVATGDAGLATEEFAMAAKSTQPP